MAAAPINEDELGGGTFVKSPGRVKPGMLPFRRPERWGFADSKERTRLIASHHTVPGLDWPEFGKKFKHKLTPITRFAEVPAREEALRALEEAQQPLETCLRSWREFVFGSVSRCLRANHRTC